jgi:hypothetical protein
LGKCLVLKLAEKQILGEKQNTAIEGMCQKLKA